MKDRALVLGGGGPVGIAWEAGVAAGLAAEGVKIADADFILGTSAGSNVGAQLAGGRDPMAIAQAQIEMGRNPTPTTPGVGGPAPDLTPLMAFIARFPQEGPPGQDLLTEIGVFALKAKPLVTEDQFVGIMSNVATRDGSWPDRFACTAVDTADGAFKVWRKGDGVQVARGVASSCAVPGIYPPITIRGRRWMDGGMRSPTNLDLAASYRRVICLAVVPPMGRSFMGAKLNAEKHKVELEGARVELILPDDASGEAFGPNLMDASRREAVALAGIEQGKREAARLKSFWS